MPVADVAITGKKDSYLELRGLLGQAIPSPFCADLLMIPIMGEGERGGQLILTIPRKRYNEVRELKPKQVYLVRGYLSEFSGQGCRSYTGVIHHFLWIDSLEPTDAEAATGIATGTCFVAGPSGRIVTANHVVEGRADIEIQYSDETTTSAKVIASSKEHDVAILEPEKKGPAHLSIVSPDEVELGAPVFTIGFPTPDILGWEPKFTDGTVSAMSVDGDAKFLQMSVPVQGGNSGGPLVTDSGDVVGVVIAKLSSSAFDNVGFASKSSAVLGLLEEEPAKATKNRSRSKSVKAVTAATCRIATKVASESASTNPESPKTNPESPKTNPESPKTPEDWPE